MSIPSPSAPIVTRRRIQRRQPVRSLADLGRRLDALQASSTHAIRDSLIAVYQRRLGWLRRDFDNVPHGQWATDFDNLDLAVRRIEVGQ